MTKDCPKEKAQIRTKIKSTLEKISSSEKASAAEQLFHTVLSLPIFNTSQNIAFYWPTLLEINCLPLLKQALELKKNCYLPVLHPETNLSLVFVEYKDNKELVKNRYGIYEPSNLSADQIISPYDLDLVFVPLLAFDTQGNRLGSGKGYYDRTFAFLSAEGLSSPSRNNAAAKQTNSPTLIGLAYSCQECSNLPRESFDLILAGLALPERFFWVETDLPNN